MKSTGKSNNIPLNYPFLAIVGQDPMKLALILNVIDPSLSGVLIRGEKGTAKSTAVRGLADILPDLKVTSGCPFNCPPDPRADLCPECREMWDSGEKPEPLKSKVKVVELPVGATEDRVLGSLDLEEAIKAGKRAFSPGILAKANRNILYVDEVNLLDDHLVDILLDSAAMGLNIVEREGVSYTHPAKFTLVGTMNPEEGDLRPQLLDRFGLCVQVEGINDPLARAEVVKRRLAFEANPKSFARVHNQAGRELKKKIAQAKRILNKVETGERVLEEVVNISVKVGTDGHRADLTMIKAARAAAAFDSRKVVEPRDLRTAALLALPHRLKRKPFEEMVFDLDKILGPE